jgi:Tol biopolymer transport system component
VEDVRVVGTFSPVARRWGVVVPVFTAAVVLGLAPSSAQDGSGAERIAFSTETEPSSDVYVLEAGPVERARSSTPIPVTRLTSSSQRESHAVWSPDGNMIAAERTDSEGTPTVVVTTAPVSPVGTADDALNTGTPEEVGAFAGSCPTWSPDSKRIAVARGESVVMRTVESGEERTLATGSCPRWSPRGADIVATQEAGRIVAINAETGETRVLHEEAQAIVGNKEWSPDGSLLAFTFSSAVSGVGLAVIDANGGSRRLLAEAPGEDIGPIRWRPDGKFVAYNTEGSLAGSMTKIFGVPLEGGSPQVLADTPRRGDRLGGWNPSGSRLVFESYSAHQLADPDFKSYVMIVEPGSQPERIGEGASPAFSPIGVPAPGSSPPPAGAQPPPTTPPTTPAGERALAVAHDRGHPALAAALQNPDDISTDLADVARSIGLAAAMILLVVFPSILFNNTYEANADEIRGWFRFGRASKPRMGRRFSETWAGFAVFTAITAVLYGFLDPSFGFDEASLTMLIILIVSIVLLTFILTVPGRRYMVSNHEDRGNIRVLPGTVAVAAICVVASRLADFSPGYLYGAIAGFVFAKELSEQEEGRQAARAAIWMLLVSVVAWVARMPLSDSVAQDDAGLGVLVLDSVLAAIFVAGIEGVVFGMIPIRFLAGSKLFAWSRAAWAIVFGIGAFLFLHVLLDPESEYLADPNSVPTTTIFVFFAVFGLLSIALWAYFRLRKRSSSAAIPGHGGPEPS